MNITWQYKVLERGPIGTDQEFLNEVREHGMQGWEAFAVEPKSMFHTMRMWLKRPTPNAGRLRGRTESGLQAYHRRK